MKLDNTWLEVMSLWAFWQSNTVTFLQKGNAKKLKGHSPLGMS